MSDELYLREFCDWKSWFLIGMNKLINALLNHMLCWKNWLSSILQF